jgi:hypothetical protein
MATQREQTLDEWCGKLPKHHRVNKELRALKTKSEAPRPHAPFGLLERVVMCFKGLRERRRKKLFIKANGWRKGKIGWHSPHGYGFAQFDLDEAYEKECLLHACT